MAKLTYETSMSLDGCTTGPDIDMENPLGVGGEQLHEWAFGTQAFEELHGRSGGEPGPDSDLIRESFEANGAMIMGRRMYSGGSGPWEDDANAMGWWGDRPPFGVPVFVLTHHEREPLPMEGGTTFHFITDGIESALEQAREAAGEKNVGIAGGASAARQYLKAGRLDELLIHVAPILIGDGVRLFDDPGGDQVELECIEATQSPAVTHLRYRVVRG
ncbi:MAG TPA: dihydrofolate reductase family protein [Solirubrobacterales bacterium]